MPAILRLLQGCGDGVGIVRGEDDDVHALGDPALEDINLMLVGGVVLGRPIVQEGDAADFVDGFLSADLAGVEVVLALELRQHGDGEFLAGGIAGAGSSGRAGGGSRAGGSGAGGGSGGAAGSGRGRAGSRRLSGAGYQAEGQDCHEKNGYALFHYAWFLLVFIIFTPFGRKYRITRP
jgi:hypothetical protein